MTKLTDMQLVLLSTAAARDDGSLLPPAESLGTRFDRIRRSVQALIDKGLATEFTVSEQAKSWRHDDDIFYGVMISDAGRQLLDGGNEATAPSNGGGGKTRDAAAGSPDAPAAPRENTKAAKLVDLLRREGGASIADIMAMTGWLPHTSRAALTGLRKKGYAISSGKTEGVTRYAIAAEA
ncbi:DUF3489 domain-containing protein [Sphingomonas montanisoli]|uniref:DUF3489 domain-containing protein n=1 Tax=Sphingomonas montanisoli TaxID=2606412 RepID=A0A5D9C363_9SPHN|nr:DUF3489 domain-containing protein [Sphingomonas montanisoli]TZG25717.1 DUF3489 domain-containing protein [Sphingomonas montanisoli]